MTQWHLPRHSPSNSDTQDRTKARICTEANYVGNDCQTVSFYRMLFLCIKVDVIHRCRNGLGNG